jgi:hypothetical protein
MTRKVYKTARGKEVDLGALLLQNENVRAVGNMNVNARGDVLDSTNKVIDQKNRQVQRQYQRQSVTPPAPRVVASSTREAKQMKQDAPAPVRLPDPVMQEEELDNYDDLPEDNNEVAVEESTPPPRLEIPAGGLAAAIARAKTVEQQLDKTPRQLRQEARLKKL